MQCNRKIIVWFVVLIGVYFGADILKEAVPYGIRWNTSNSLPYWMFLSHPSSGIHRGDYVAFHHPLSRTRLVKQVVGLPGDLIERAEDYVFCNGQNCGQALSITPSGKFVTPVGSHFVPKGCLFVHATHPDSFDSRYQEFGFVKIDKIEEQLWPLF